MAKQYIYRPLNQGNDSYEKGIYLVTLVVKDLRHVFGELNMDALHPAVNVNEAGRLIGDMWQLLPEAQCGKGNKLKILAQCVMPDHWHGVIEAEERLAWSMGKIMQAFKEACTSLWMKQADVNAGPLFDDRYDDVICMTKGQREAMTAYVKDNPRRAIYRHLYPQFMLQRFHVVIAGRDYAAFGNLFLLRWANKEQVFCHRRDSNGVPYEQTSIFKQERSEWLRSAYDGLTVLVTPGISKGEQQLKNDCLERGLPLIHLQKDTMPPGWKPDRRRFDACAAGRLLILAPWELDKMQAVDNAGHGMVPPNTDYSRFHNMNELAREICVFYGEARIVR